MLGPGVERTAWSQFPPSHPRELHIKGRIQVHSKVETTHSNHSPCLTIPDNDFSLLRGDLDRVIYIACVAGDVIHSSVVGHPKCTRYGPLRTPATNSIMGLTSKRQPANPTPSKSALTQARSVAPMEPLGDSVLAGEAEMVREHVTETRAGHGREDVAVVGAAVVAVAAAGGCTRRSTAAAVAPVVDVAAGHSCRSTSAAVVAVVAAVAAARSSHCTPASAVVVVEGAVHSYSTTAAVEIATASAAAPAATRSSSLRCLRSRRSLRRRCSRRSRSSRCP